MKLPALIGAVAVALVVGFALGYVLKKAPENDGPGEHAKKNEELKGTVESLRSVLEDERVRTKEARDAADRARDALAKATAAAEPEPVNVAGDVVSDTATSTVKLKLPTVRYYGDLYNGALARIDWNIVGNNMSEMPPLINRIARELLEERPPSAEAVGRIQQLNGPLITAALQVADELPGTGINGKFAHPAFQLNAIVSTLEAAEMPVTESQERALIEAANLGMDSLSRRLENYGPETLELRKLFEEAEILDDFFDDVYEVLTPEQAGVLSTDETRGRIRLSIFSSSLIYVMRAEPLPFGTHEDIVNQFVSKAGTELGLTPEQRDQARPLIDEWANRLPRDLLDWETNTLDRQGMLETRRVTGWAKQTVTLLERFAPKLALNEGQRARVRRLGGVPVPIKR